MKVLFVAADPALRLDQQGGAGTHIRGTLAALRGQGIEVTALVGSAADATSPTLAQRPAGRVSGAPAWMKPVGRDLRLILHDRTFAHGARGFDCVYERSAYLSQAGKRLAEQARIPYVVESDGILVESRRAAYGVGLPRLAERIERRKLRSAQLVVAMAEAQRERLVRIYGVDPGRILVKGLGVERELVDRPARDVPAESLIGWAGTFQPYHGIELLLDAARLLQTEAGLVLIGDGPTFARVRAASAGLNVDYLGRLSRAETLARLTACRVLVIPDGARDLYPIKLLEYAALGRPIVCPTYPAYAEFAEDGRSLLFGFRPGSARELARALDEALAQAAETDRVERLRRLVASQYTWDSVGRRLAEGLRAVVAEN
jgi:starch synthase